MCVYVCVRTMEKSPRAGPEGPEKGNLILSPAEDAGDMISSSWKEGLQVA